MVPTRRGMLAGSAALAAPALLRGEAWAGWEPSTRIPDVRIEIVDPSFARYRVFSATVERLATGFRWAEGPVWLGLPRLLLFSDIAENRIVKWDEATGQVSTFRQPSHHSNGNARDRQGRLLTCEGQMQRVTRTEHDGSITVLADGFEGKPFNSPNDLVCRSDGSIWFTDPTFGPNPYEGMKAPTTESRVYRIDPETRTAKVVANDIRGPNGLAFSPDESILYVVEARATPNRLILAYDVAENGTALANKRVFHDCGDGTADGFKVDIDGNLWCGWGMSEANDGVVVINPTGKLIGRIRLPERCANVCFGGWARNRLFMAATHAIYSLYVNTQGTPGG